VHTVLGAELEDRHSGKSGHSWECGIIINHEGIWSEEVCWIQVAAVRY
jgi:glycerol-3-phosphate dehydrogenase